MDDIDFGCGGAILRLAQDYPNWLSHWVVFRTLRVRSAEAQHGATLFAGKNADQAPLLKEFQNGFMPFMGREVKAVFEELKSISPALSLLSTAKIPARSSPDFRTDLEQLSRPFILEYEIPKHDDDLGHPNLFVPVAYEVCEQKVRYLMDVSESQRSKRWFQPEIFFGLLRLKGMEWNPLLLAVMPKHSIAANVAVAETCVFGG